MIRMISAILMIVGCAGASQAQAQAQSGLEILRKIKSTANAAQVSYDYKIRLVNGKGLIADSVRGKVYKMGKDYIDSSSFAYTCYKAGYFFKLDYDKKVAGYYNVTAVARKLGLSLADAPGSLLQISDSVIMRYGKIKVDTSLPGYFTVRVAFSKPSLPPATFVIDRKTYKLRSATMQMPDDDGYVKEYMISHIAESVSPEAFDTNRFFHLDKGKVVLAPAYQHYKLTTVIN